METCDSEMNDGIPVGSTAVEAIEERLFDRLDHHAAIRPDAPAVEDSELTLSYQEIAARSRAVAAVLSGSGIRRGDRVAVLAAKSADLIAVLYGILRAGAAYVPLSADWPTERVRWVINDVGAAAVVTDRAHLERLDRATSPRILSIDDVGPEVASLRGALSGRGAAPADAGAADVGERDLAYVIYTSGSTGDPKGVMHSHRSALAFVRWAANELALDHNDRLASHAPFNFDLSIFDIYAASRAGATLVLPDAGTSTVPARFIVWLNAQRITTVYSVPGVWIVGLQASVRPELSHTSLRTIIYAGEAMAPKHVLALQEALPRAEIHNFYGPTETNVCTAYRVPRLDPKHLPLAIPIGLACSGDTVSVDDEELVVRGESLLLGYWGKPPRAADGPYRTGDLVRFDEALGGYVFLGRRDGMRKIRGFRVELGEVEACLLKSASTAEVVAAVDERDEAHPMLVAFVVPARGAPRDTRELKRHCAGFLPPYMVPRIIWRESMPVTATGKIDRRALNAELAGRPTEMDAKA